MNEVVHVCLWDDTFYSSTILCICICIQSTSIHARHSLRATLCSSSRSTFQLRNEAVFNQLEIKTASCNTYLVIERHISFLFLYLYILYKEKGINSNHPNFYIYGSFHTKFTFQYYIRIKYIFSCSLVENIRHLFFYFIMISRILEI